MEKSGLPADKAFSLLKLPGAEQKRLVEILKSLARGMDIATAGVKSGLFTPFESRLLRAALNAGSPASTYHRLAETYAAKAQQAAAIKSRMRLPLVVFVIALFVQPLPTLVAGSLSMGAYLLHVLRPLIVLAIVYFFAMRFSRQQTNSTPSSTPSLTDALLLRLPVFGTMHLRRNVADFVQSLALLLEAGVPMFDALPDAVGSIGNSVIKKEFAAIKPRMTKGATLSVALAQPIAKLAYPGSDQLIGFIKTGEASGKLPEMLQRLADGEAAAIQDFQQQVADWLPRVIYGCVALWIAYGILTGNAFMPQVPEELR